jgi:molecular chaperone DnaJ
MDTKDHYAALGVDRSASEDDIKKAFRQLSLKYHPDRNPGDKIAETKYKEITEAFSVLGDSDKRSTYDFNSRRVSPFGNPFSNPFNMNMDGFDYSTIFETVFNNPGRQRQSRSMHRGQNVEFTIQISVEESIKGCTKKIRVNSNELKITCQTCNGSGSAANSNKIICTKCAGSGRLVGHRNSFAVKACNACNGSGQIPTNPCPTCKGSGQQLFDREIVTKIPAGIQDGMRLRHAQMGTPGSPPGDLFITVNIKQSESHKRENHDIIVTHKIDLKLAILGGPSSISLLEGTILNIEIPPGSQSGDEIVKQGLGTRSLFNSRQPPGDLRIKLEILIPKNLSNRAKKLLEEFAEEIETKL